MIITLKLNMVADGSTGGRVPANSLMVLREVL